MSKDAGLHGNQATTPQHDPAQSDVPGDDTSDTSAAQGHTTGAGYLGRRGLIRPRADRQIAGVCAGIARASGTDPVLWRVLLAVGVLFGGVGLAAYLLGWLLLPGEGDSGSPLEALFGRGRSRTSTGVTVVLAIAVAFLLVVTIEWSPITILVVVAAIGYLLYRQRHDVPPHFFGSPGPSSGGPAMSRPVTDTPPHPTPAPSSPLIGGGAATPPDAATTHPAAISEPDITTEHTAEARLAEGPDQAAQEEETALLAERYERQEQEERQEGHTTPTAPLWPPQPPYGGPPRPPYGSSPPPPSKPPPRAPGRHAPDSPAQPSPAATAGRVALFGMLLTTGLMGVLDLAGASIGVSGYVAAALAVVGLTLLVAAWIGRARWLIWVGAALSVALAISTFVESANVDTHGSRTWTPHSLSQVKKEYRLDFGTGVLDLTQVDFTGQRAPIDIDVDGAHMEIIVPPDVDATGETTVSYGNAVLFLDEVSAAHQATHDFSDLGADGQAGPGELILHINVRAANVEVRR